MAQQQNKPVPEPKRDPLDNVIEGRFPLKLDKQREAPRAAADDIYALEKKEEEQEENKFKEDFEEHLKTHPNLKAHKSDIYAIREFRRTFHLNRIEPENLSIYVVHSDYNVAVARAFGLENSKSILTLESSRAKAKEFEKKSGIRTVKGIAERHRIPERADVVVVLDKKVDARKNLLRNVAPGGWMLCRMDMASALRATGKYEFKGVIEERSSPSVDEYKGDDFWEEAAVKNDEQFIQASNTNKVHGAKGIVTYDEAVETLKRAGIKTTDVIGAYRELIQRAREQDQSASEDGETMLTYTRIRTIDGVKITETIPVDTVLPTFSPPNDKRIVIMKKHHTV